MGFQLLQASRSLAKTEATLDFERQRRSDVEACGWSGGDGKMWNNGRKSLMNMLFGEDIGKISFRD